MTLTRQRASKQTQCRRRNVCRGWSEGQEAMTCRRSSRVDALFALESRKRNSHAHARNRIREISCTLSDIATFCSRVICFSYPQRRRTLSAQNDATNSWLTRHGNHHKAFSGLAKILGISETNLVRRSARSTIFVFRLCARKLRRQRKELQK